MTSVEDTPTFNGFIEASGQARIWNKLSDQQKLNTVNWSERQTYSQGTLIANWNEDGFDISRLSKVSPLPSQYDHYYETLYRTSYSKNPPKVPEVLRHSSGLRLTH